MWVESTFRYISQYINVLNHKFAGMSPEKCLKSINVFAKRIAQKDEEYEELYADLKQEAKRLNCDVEDLRMDIDFPEEIKW